MKTVIISDIHGCYDEFIELLDVIKYDKKSTRLIILGDMVDRGPKSYEVIKKVKSLNVEVAVGNHDSKMVRWLKHNKNFIENKVPHPMKKVLESDYVHYLKLNEDELNWVKNLPTKIHIKDNFWGIHAGCVSNTKFEDQKFDALIRVRYVDANGKMLALPKNKKQPENSFFWTELWDQPYSIIYGHHVHDEPRIDRNKNNICIGIDGGAPFGKYLNAFCLEDFTFTKVKSKIYCKSHEEE